MTDIQKIDKYLAEASAMTVKMGKKHTDAVMALRNIISEIGFVNADSNLGWDSEIQKANKIIDLADGSIAKLLMKYNRATV